MASIDQDWEDASPNAEGPSPTNAHWRPQAPNGNNAPPPVVTELSYSSSVESSPVTTRASLRSALILPHQEKSLSGIAIRSFLLGFVLATSIYAAILLAWLGYRIWRASLFLAALALFHFLEFYITAQYNTQFANISAFLLSRNGRAYNIAHTAAMTECIFTSLFLPSWQAKVASTPLLLTGLCMLLIGQSTRTMAMVQAGTNFNHTVQTRKAEGHQLVTSGIYHYLRHPSYFGFFWWGLGTQVVCGNTICLLGYAVVLWKFFRMRTAKEEEFLVEFFGEEYQVYKKRTPVGIPFIP